MDEVVIFMEVAVIAVTVIFWIFLCATKVAISERNGGRGKSNGLRFWICHWIQRLRSHGTPVRRDLEEGTYYSRSQKDTDEKINGTLADAERRSQKDTDEKINETLADAERRCVALERRLKAVLQEKNDLSMRYVDLERRLEAELQEKNDLSKRLSAIIASRIKDGNTTIVDLSDENRPTKLAEYFSELYDNEWTACFDELESQAIEESEIISILLKILTDIFQACLEWSTEDYLLLVQRAIDRTYIDNEKLPARGKEEVEFPKDILQPIREIKKRRALKVLPTIHEFVRRKVPTLLQGQFASAEFQMYIQKCTEFSWLAVVQDPPLVLLADRGTKFDRKLFKEYMRRGPFVEFVVWPALLVEEGGAILSKGVAQGTDKDQVKDTIYFGR